MDTVLVGKVAGNAWVRQADGSLLALREGMRVPANAEVVTDSGASVQLQGDGLPPITLGENRQLQVSDELANTDVDPTAQTVPEQLDPTAARVLAALQAGEDPFEQLDPTAAVNSGAGGDDGGSSFTRLASIIEPTTPLALAYPKPIRPEDELPRLGGYGRNSDPEYTLPADLDLTQVNNDSETVTSLNIGQYFSDPDGHTLTFTATGLPPGLTIDPNTGVISGTLDRSASQGGQGGVYTVVVTANDPYGGSVDLPFIWTALNPPPEAADDRGTTEENTVLAVPKEKGLLSNDVDPDGDDLVVTDIENADGLRVSPGTPLPGSNGGTLVVNPDGSYTFTPGKDFDYLAEGETTTVEFEYTISDGEGGTDKAKLVITITGTNDAPVIDGAGTDDAGTVVELEDGHDEEGTRLHTTGGKITFTDVDASDNSHRSTLEANPENGQTFLGNLVLGDIDPITKELTWEFTVSDADLDHLAEGETLKQKYTVTISDGKGGSVTQEIVVTIIGTNDAPEIDAARTKAEGTVTEIPEDEPGQDVTELTTDGIITFTDVDIADSHTTTLQDNPEQGQIFLGELKLGSIDPVTKQVTWEFKVKDADLNHLAEGEKLVQKYTVTIKDDHGGVATQEIIVTIVGSNDSPVMSGVVDGAVTEDVTFTTSGQLDKTDVDLKDTHEWYFGNKDTTAAGQHGTFTIDQNGKWTYDLNNKDPKVQALGEGETLIETIEVTVDDGKGGTDTKVITVTINGTNDAPVATEATGDVVESGVKADGSKDPNAEFKGTQTATGDLIKDHVTDVDASDKGKLTIVGASFDGNEGAVADGSITVEGIYGTLVIHADGTYTYTLDNTRKATQSLTSSDKVKEVFTYTASDGKANSSSTLTINVQGTNDRPEISDKSELGGEVIEAGHDQDGKPVAGKTSVVGVLKATDVDNGHTEQLTWHLQVGDTVQEGPTQTIKTDYGTLTLDSEKGKWTYELDNDSAATQALGQGEKHEEKFEVLVRDPEGAWNKETITVVINGTNDAPVATEATGDVVESGVKAGGSKDPNAEFKGTQTATGDLIKDHVTDVDASDKGKLTIVGASFDGNDGAVADGSITVEGIYGTLVIHADGTYTYTLDNDRPATQSLTSSDKVKEVFTYTASDGKANSSSTLTINVQGTNDRPEISDKSDLGGEVIEAGHDQAGKPVPGKSSVGGVLVGTDVDNGHAEQLTWHLQVGDTVQEGPTQTIKTDYGTLTLNSETGKWTYELDNGSKATQALGQGEKHEEKFEVLVRDPEGAWSKEIITVTINGTNDAPTVKDHLVNFDEDPTEGVNKDSKVGNVLDGSENPEGGKLTVISFTVGGEKYTGGDVGNEVPVTVQGNKVGTFVINKDGSYEFTPETNYSGEVPPITYVVQEPDNDKETGLTAEGKLTFTINPVADEPKYKAEKTSVTVNEDEWVSLGLKAPEVTDKIDHNGTGAGDNPELLGVITLSGLPLGSVLELSDGTTITMTEQGAMHKPVNGDPVLLKGDEGVLKVVLNKGSHISGLDDPSYLKISSDQFESIKILPPADSSKNFTVHTEVTSYEVDDHGVPLPKADGPDGLNGATTKVDVYVGVQAVTDPVELSVGGQKEGSSTISMKEDEPLDIAALLSITYPNVDGNDQPDHDGSELRWFEVSGLPIGSIVNGQTVTEKEPTIKINAPGLSGEEQIMPKITITPPHNFSGKIEGVKVTLKAQDQDQDGIDGTTATKGETLESSITLTLDVDPVADHLEIGEQKGYEDSRIPLLSNVKLGDGDGSEKLTALTIKGVPADWVIRDAQGDEVKPTSTAGGMNSYKLPTNADGVVDLDAFKGWTAQPPAQSSTDGRFKLEYTVKDHKLNGDDPITDANGDPIIHTGNYEDVLTITVIPVAERVGTNEPGHSDLNHGLTMTTGHDYSQVVGGKEDTAFALNIKNGFNLKADWDNPDAGSEQTFALLKPYLEEGFTGDDAVGAVFTYTTYDQEGKPIEHKVVYTGQEHGVEIPIQYLDTVTFTPPPNVAGEFKIQVQAKTVDTKEDNSSYQVEAISGEAWLTGIKITPVADEVASLGISPAYGKEDSAIALSIRPSSSDSSETFNVKIDKIPADATLQYGDQTLTADSVGIAGLTVAKNKDGSWSVVINNFDSNADLFVTPPHNSNADFSLTVSAQTVDALEGYQTDVGTWKTQELPVRVQGVADAAEVTAKTTDESVDYTEAAVETNGGITLGDLIANVSQHDEDGSEQLSFRITGLDAMFDLEGATFLGGEGANRVWVVGSEDELRAVKVKTPEHFSGTVKVTVTPVTTENDGDWKGSPSTDLIATVTPSPEAIGQNSGSLVEDEKHPIHFGLDTNNGDLDEKVTAVFIKVEDFAAKGFNLYLGDQLLAEAVQPENGYYKLSGKQLTQLTGQATTADFAHNQGDNPFTFTVKYEITDYSTDGTVAPVVEVSSEQEYTLTVSAVTDPVELGEVSVVGVSPNIDITTTDNTVTLGSTGSFAVNLKLAKTDGAGTPTDNDGSERFTQVVVEGVPNGVVVEGLKVGDHSIGQVSYLGNGKWLVTISETEQPKFTNAGGINAQLQFRAGASVGSASGDIKITVVTKDTDASTLETDSVTLGFESTLQDGSGNEPAVKVTWTPKDDVVGQEDTAFTLSELGEVTLSVDHDDGNDINFAVTVKVPEGSTVQVDGVPVVSTQVGNDGSYVILVTGKGDEQALKDLLSKIEVTPPAHLNTNLGEFEYEVGITAYHPDSSSQSETTVPGIVPLTPVTDEGGVSVTLAKEGDASAAPEEGSPVSIQVSIGSGVDGLSELGDKLYIKLGEAGFSGSGVLKDAEGNTLVVQHLSADPELGLAAGEYYVLTVPAGTTVGPKQGDYVVNLTYQPSADDQYKNGSLTVDAWVQKTEHDSTKVVMAEGSNTANLEGISNGYEIFVGKQEGDVWVQKGLENQDGKSQIKLDISGKGLLDTDGSEEVYVALLKNLPNGFLVFYGNSAEDAKLAQNAGAGEDGSALWTLPLKDGQLPGYVAIVPPQNWSGTLKDLELSVLNGEKGGVVRDDVAKFDLSIEAVADGIYSMNTAPAFGREGEIIRLNLNIMLKDGLPVDSEATDQSVERLSLELKGLGEHAAFYVGDTLLAFNGEGKGFSYDADKGTYKVYGLSQQDIDSLGVLQAKPVDPHDSGSWKVTFDAWTEESSNGAPSDKKSGEFDITLQVQKVSAEDDKLLFDGATLLDGGKGEDTVWLRFGEDIDFDQYGENDQPDNLFKNIEVFDLTREGFDHSITNLSVQDVLDITDSRNTLTIKADHGDSITLGDGWTYHGERTSQEGNAMFVFKDKDGGDGELRIESTDPELLKEVADSLKDKGI